jgi:hypothetical protein
MSRNFTYCGKYEYSNFASKLQIEWSHWQIPCIEYTQYVTIRGLSEFFYNSEGVYQKCPLWEEWIFHLLQEFTISRNIKTSKFQKFPT